MEGNAHPTKLARTSGLVSCRSAAGSFQARLVGSDPASVSGASKARSTIRSRTSSGIRSQTCLAWMVDVPTFSGPPGLVAAIGRMSNGGCRLAVKLRYHSMTSSASARRPGDGELRFGCCARAMNGHAAAPPISPMFSRRDLSVSFFRYRSKQSDVRFEVKNGSPDAQLGVRFAIRQRTS